MLEGFDTGGRHFSVQMTATQVSVVLAATDTPEGRLALSRLVDQVAS